MFFARSDKRHTKNAKNWPILSMGEWKERKLVRKSRNDSLQNNRKRGKIS